MQSNANHSEPVAIIAGIVHDSLVDGPGLRTVVFFSGCSVGCPQCHNVKFWNREAGQPMTIPALAAQLKAESPTRKITISGGEPLEQPEAVMALIDHLPGYQIGLYTSRELEEIDPTLLVRLAFVKTGRFDKYRKVEGEYFGSVNQKLIILE